MAFVFFLMFVLFTPLAAVHAEDWTEFRGPTGQGHSQAKDVPTRWSESENIAWKVPVPGLGWSSPVVAGGLVWLTSAENDGRRLLALCYDAKTGANVKKVVIADNNLAKSIQKKNSHASPTPIIDQDRVFVHFGTYCTVCLTAGGEVIWRTKLDYEPRHGPGGSPTLFDNLLIINCDGSDVQYVVALDKQTGEVIWKTPRAHASAERLNGAKMAPMAFSTPLVAEIDGVHQVISAGGDHVAGYDVRTGQELWWSQYDGYSVVPRPVIGHDMVFVSSSYDDAVFYGIQLGGKGNITGDVRWTLSRGAPFNPSALIVGNEIYIVSDNGVASCLDARTGKSHWQQRIGGDFSASPFAAEGRIYLTNESGVTTVIEPGKRYRQIAKNEIDGRTLASLAPIDGGLFLRSDSHLYKIGR
jgi:outer membrane protein assembly factor BamB